MGSLTNYVATLILLPMHDHSLWSPSHGHVPVEEHRYQESKATGELSVVQRKHSAATVKGMKPHTHAEFMTTTPVTHAYPLANSALCQYLPSEHATKGSRGDTWVRPPLWPDRTKAAEPEAASYTAATDE